MHSYGNVPECRNPVKICKGCEYSYRPDLYDGGCKLHFEHTAESGFTAEEDKEITTKHKEAAK